MSAYFQNMAFGGGGIDLKGQKAATDLFIGATYTKEKNVYETESETKGLDYGSDNGTYKMRAILAIRIPYPITIPNADTVTFTLMESNDDDEYAEGFNIAIPLEKLNEARNKPIILSVPSIGKRYYKWKFNFSGGSATSSDTVTSGTMLATIELKEF